MDQVQAHYNPLADGGIDNVKLGQRGKLLFKFSYYRLHFRLSI